MASGFVPTVGDAVRSVLAQTRAGEIAEILVCGADEHGVLPDDPRIRCLEAIRPGPACFAYNAALAAMLPTSETVVIMDGDCTLAPDWLDRVLARHAQGWQGVAGGVIAPPGPYLATAYNLSLFHDWLADRPAGPRPCLPTMNLSLSTAMVRDVGALREDWPRVYDFDWTLRMTRSGHRLFFEPEAHATHRPLGLTLTRFWRTGYADGSCSQAARREYDDQIDHPWLLNHPRLLTVLAPAIATWVTARTVWRLRRDPRALSVIPPMWLDKCAWVLGAGHGRVHGPLPVQDFQRPPGIDETSSAS